MAKRTHPREKQKNTIRRKSASILSHDRILIVTEGKKTERNYFNEIRQHWRIRTVDVVIDPSDGTIPQQVVDYALSKCKEDNGYSKVFCVFDRDDHPNFINAIHSAVAHHKKLKNDNKELVEFYAIPSIPCFELWFLLHFTPMTRYIHRDEVIRTLKKNNYIPRFEKGGSGYFDIIREKFETAKQNAARLTNNNPCTSGNDINPYTAVGTLVDELYKLQSHIHY